MKNYSYSIDNDKVIVSEEEHAKVLESVKAGKTLVVLRNGSLIINFSFVKKVVPTDNLTTEQEEANEKYLALPVDKRPKKLLLK